MAIFTGGARRRGQRYLSEFQAPLGEALSAQASEAWRYNPTVSAFRTRELLQAGYGEAPPSSASARAALFEGGRHTPERAEPVVDESERMSQEDAQSRLREADLENQLTIPENGITEQALGILMERKREEIATRTVLDRAPSGIGPATLRFGTALGVAFADPINLAAAFVPVVGQARYAKALEQAGSTLGRAGVRARFGAIEGSVGIAAVEPLVYGSAQFEQADYTMMDSLFNIAIGTALGAGLHMGAGGIRDAARRGRPAETVEPQGATAERVARYNTEDRRNLLQMTLAQESRGARASVEAMMSYLDAKEVVLPSTLASARRASIDDYRARMEAQMETGTLAEPMPAARRQEVQAQLQDVETRLGRQSDDVEARIAAIQSERGVGRQAAKRRATKTQEQERAELERQREHLTEQLRQDDLSLSARKDLETLRRGAVPEHLAARIDADAQARLDAARDASAHDIARAATSRPDINLQRLWDNVREEARANRRPDAQRGTDPEIAQRLRRDLERQQARPENVDEARAETQQLLDEINDLQTRVGDEFEVMDARRLQELDNDIAAAERFSQEMRILGPCRMRKGAV